MRRVVVVGERGVALGRPLRAGNVAILSWSASAPDGGVDEQSGTVQQEQRTNRVGSQRAFADVARLVVERLPDGAAIHVVSAVGTGGKHSDEQQACSDADAPHPDRPPWEGCGQL